MQTRAGFAGTVSSLIACYALGVAGCDGVGQPLVDRISRDAALDILIECADPRECFKWEAIAAYDADRGVLAPSLATPIELEGCPPVDESQCEKSTEGLDGPIVPKPASGCEVLWELADQATSAPDDTELSCGRLRIEAADLDKPCSAVLQDIVWTRANVRIGSAQPLTLELDGAVLQDTFIQLQGPVTLRIVNSVAFDGVRIKGDLDDAASRVELNHVSGENLIIGDGIQRFAGAVVATRSVLPRAQFTVASLELESVVLQGGWIDVTTFDAADLTLSYSTLAVQKALLTACILDQVKLTECGAMTLLSSTVGNSRLCACRDAPLRVYSSEVIESGVDGSIESDRTNWFRVLFGGQERTDLLAWDGMFTSVNFCANAQTARLASWVACSRCDEGLEQGKTVCAMEFADDMGNNYCDKLNKPSLCPDPQPVRERP